MSSASEMQDPVCRTPRLLRASIRAVDRALFWCHSDVILTSKISSLRGRVDVAGKGAKTVRTPEVVPDLRGTALVQRGGEVVFQYAGGTTGGQPEAPIDVGTRFQIASVSKQFTAAAVLLLVDGGLLSVDDHLVGHLEGSPSIWEGITVHQLLCHTAGLVHWPQLPELDLTAHVPADEELELFRRAPLLSIPGTEYAYSSPGYVLLAHIVERVSDTPYREFLSDEIFSPLGLRSTFAGNGVGQAGLASPLHLGEPVASFELDIVGMGAGDVWSTIDDLAAWDAALEAGRLLSDESRRQMFTVHTHVTEELGGVTLEGYGYAWYMADVAGHSIVFHTGGNAGFQSINATMPDDDARFIVLTNDTSTDLFTTALSLIAVALDGGG
jgi:CubicO group peptidase (beta-lactamase class C family)